MQAFHTLWTRPFAAGHPGRPFAVSDYDLFCMILSAALWKQENGPITLVTDQVGARYVRSCGLDILWDGGIDTTLDTVPYTIDPQTFWAAGKLFALNTQRAPCVMLDTDFIVWSDLSKDTAGSALSVIHREELNPDIYPDPSQFLCEAAYRYPRQWDFTLPPCNTALNYFGSESLRSAYCEQSLAFIRAARGRHPLHYMVFAEQRLLSMCANQLGISIDCFSTLPQLFSPGQSKFTHLWGYKQHLAQNTAERQRFCTRCAQRIARDFPALRQCCLHHPLLRPYFNN